MIVLWSGVPIKIRRATDKKAKWELVSDSNGEFAQRVPPGKMDYIIQADIKTAEGPAQAGNYRADRR